uniref:AAA_12 domain-containing protein n=2 Tax=Caenorhabditis japonica TaxID=281687 RepID=A0A8R1DGY3_CAEJA
MHLLEIGHHRAIPHHRKGNGATERTFRTFHTVISKYINKEHSDWDTILPFTTFSYNNTVHSTTGATPFFLVFGRDPTLTIDRIIDPAPATKKTDIGWFKESLTTILREVWKQAATLSREAQATYQKKANEGAKASDIRPGDRKIYEAEDERKSIDDEESNDEMFDENQETSDKSGNFETDRRMTSDEVENRAKLTQKAEKKKKSRQIEENLSPNMAPAKETTAATMDEKETKNARRNPKLLFDDRRQLPPFADSCLPQQLHDYAVGNVLEDATSYGRFPQFPLLKVHRCPQQITQILSEMFYQGQLRTSKEPTSFFPELRGIGLPHSHPLVVVKHNFRHAADGTSVLNADEGRLALHLAAGIRQSRIKASISILSFYKVTCAFVEDNAPEGIHSSTADGAQGREYDYVFVLTSRTSGNQGFLDDSKRINVALSRTKIACIVLDCPTPTAQLTLPDYPTAECSQNFP